MTDLEKTLEAGLIALIAVAQQIREKQTGEVADLQLLEAKSLLGCALAGVSSKPFAAKLGPVRPNDIPSKQSKENSKENGHNESPKSHTNIRYRRSGFGLPDKAALAERGTLLACWTMTRCTASRLGARRVSLANCLSVASASYTLAPRPEPCSMTPTCPTEVVHGDGAHGRGQERHQRPSSSMPHRSRLQDRVALVPPARKAMEDLNTTPMGSKGQIVEIDETRLGGRKLRKGNKAGEWTTKSPYSECRTQRAGASAKDQQCQGAT